MDDATLKNLEASPEGDVNQNESPAVAAPAPDGSADPNEFPAGIRWVYGRDIASWPVTINLSSATHTRKSVTVRYDRLQDIPAWYVPGDPNNHNNVNGCIWLVREYQGVWYIGTFDYLRVGQMTKDFGPAPNYMFDPRPGDRIGFMVSTMARAEDGTYANGQVYRERSNIYWTTW